MIREGGEGGAERSEIDFGSRRGEIGDGAGFMGMGIYRRQWSHSLHTNSSENIENQCLLAMYRSGRVGWRMAGSRREEIE